LALAWSASPRWNRLVLNPGSLVLGSGTSDGVPPDPWANTAWLSHLADLSELTLCQSAASLCGRPCCVYDLRKGRIGMRSSDRLRGLPPHHARDRLSRTGVVAISGVVQRRANPTCLYSEHLCSSMVRERDSIRRNRTDDPVMQMKVSDGHLWCSDGNAD